MKNSRMKMILAGSLAVLLFVVVAYATKTALTHPEQTETSQKETENTSKKQSESTSKKKNENTSEQEEPAAATEDGEAGTKTGDLEETLEPAVTEKATEKVVKTPAVTEVPKEKKTQNTGKGGVIAIDAGHQRHANNGTEPIGPGASEKKPKVSSGTSGVASGLAEYELTLQVAKKLKKALMAQGYEVVMIRESHDVDIPNSERAAMANKAHADAFIRIHADGSDSSASQGAMTICPTAGNPYCANIYKKSKKLAQCVIREFVKATGCKSRNIWETDTMSGINWCKVPVTILEMGFMSNREEDLKMADAKYQDKMVSGIVNGINAYMK